MKPLLGSFYVKNNDCGSQLSCQPASSTEKGEVNTVQSHAQGTAVKSLEKHDSETLENVRLGQMSMKD